MLTAAPEPVVDPGAREGPCALLLWVEQELPRLALLALQVEIEGLPDLLKGDRENVLLAALGMAKVNLVSSEVDVRYLQARGSARRPRAGSRPLPRRRGRHVSRSPGRRPTALDVLLALLPADKASERADGDALAFRAPLTPSYATRSRKPSSCSRRAEFGHHVPFESAVLPARLVQQLQELVRGELDLLVTPLGGSVMAGDDSGSV
jgi:hypothetical protein